jgi:hypothetical protein
MAEGEITMEFAKAGLNPSEAAVQPGKTPEQERSIERQKMIGRITELKANYRRESNTGDGNPAQGIRDRTKSEEEVKLGNKLRQSAFEEFCEAYPEEIEFIKERSVDGYSDKEKLIHQRDVLNRFQREHSEAFEIYMEFGFMKKNVDGSVNKEQWEDWAGVKMNEANGRIEPYRTIIKDENGKEYPLEIRSLNSYAVAEAYNAIGATDLAKIAGKVLSESMKLREKRNALSSIPTISHAIGKDSEGGLADILSGIANEGAKLKNTRRVLSQPPRRT